MTEREYAMRFCMLVLQDKKDIQQKEQYKDSMKPFIP